MNAEEARARAQAVRDAGVPSEPSKNDRVLEHVRHSVHKAISQAVKQGDDTVEYSVLRGTIEEKDALIIVEEELRDLDYVVSATRAGSLQITWEAT